MTEKKESVFSLSENGFPFILFARSVHAIIQAYEYSTTTYRQFVAVRPTYLYKKLEVQLYNPSKALITDRRGSSAKWPIRVCT